MIYVRSAATKNYNDRTLWYRNNLRTIKQILRFSAILNILFMLVLLWRIWRADLSLSLFQFLLIILFPVSAGWYVFSARFLRIKSIRQTGWIKPFVVGFTWAGWATVYPVIMSQMQNGKSIRSGLVPLLLLWLQDFLFFSTNAVLFDIKDYRTDFHDRLNTYPVLFGVRNTFRFIIAPLMLFNLGVFFIFQSLQNFSPAQTIIQLIPYVLLTVIMINHRLQRSLLYYLAAVDGLVFVKAVCGITSVLIFKRS